MSESVRSIGLLSAAGCLAIEVALVWSGTSSWLAIPGATAADAGAALMFMAGRHEASARLANSRALARRAGFAMLVGTVGWAATGPALVAASLGLVAGGAALLSGLSGKPRPSGSFAALLYAAARATDLVL